MTQGVKRTFNRRWILQRYNACWSRTPCTIQTKRERLHLRVFCLVAKIELETKTQQIRDASEVYIIDLGRKVLTL